MPIGIMFIKERRFMLKFILSSRTLFENGNKIQGATNNDNIICTYWLI